MARTKAADKLTSRNEILERLWMSTAKKLLGQLEKEDADMSASMFATITKFLSLNDFDADALAKVQENRERALRMAEHSKGSADGASVRPKSTYDADYEVPAVDPDLVKRIGERIETWDREAAAKRTIPDATNQ